MSTAVRLSCSSATIRAANVLAFPMRAMAQADTRGSRLLPAVRGTLHIRHGTELMANSGCSHSCSTHPDSGRWLTPTTFRMGVAQRPGPRALTVLLRPAPTTGPASTAGRSTMASARPPATTGTCCSDALTGFLAQQRPALANPHPAPSPRPSPGSCTAKLDKFMLGVSKYGNWYGLPVPRFHGLLHLASLLGCFRGPAHVTARGSPARHCPHCPHCLHVATPPPTPRRHTRSEPPFL